jgi:hypothetical protein
MSNDSSSKGRAEAGAGGMLLRTLQPSGPPGPVPQITVDGIEVVQVIQDLNHTVPLVAEKQTVVRVYLSTGGSSPITVRGTLAARRAGLGGWTQIPSTREVVLNPADAGPAGLRRKRETLGLSLNFLLPAALLTAGDVQVELAHVETVNPIVSIPVPAGAARQVTLHPAVPLRVRVIGIRYQIQPPGGPAQTYEPAAIDYALIRSWLGRAYPVVEVVWSQTVVDWPGTPIWPMSDNALATWGRDFVNPFLSALRAQDVAAGTDHRTHFFGLAADGGGFMRGWAATIPASPDPTVVASGPAGRPSGSFGWDTDGSYADWYTGHELAHTFGREHPGFCSNNSQDDPAFPYPHGQIANNNGDFTGYDAGDPAHAIAPVALPGVVWHDLMTYCDHQWLSGYTYEAIYRRLVAEDALAAPGSLPGALPLSGGGPQPAIHNTAAVGGGAMPSQPNGIHIVARVNQTKGTGQFRFVTPVAAIATAGQMPTAASEYRIRVKQANGSTIEYPVAFRRDACGDSSDTDVTGSLDVIIPNHPEAVALELVHNNQVLDIFTAGAEPPEPQDIQPATAGAGPAASLTASASASSRPKIVWTLAGTGGATMAAASVTGPTAVYTVQLSTDDGQTWRTVGVGLVDPETTLDPHLFAGKDSIQVRVTATNGFKTKTTTQTLDVKDL